MVKTIKKMYNGKEFKLTVSTDCGGAIISVSINELTRPNWKIFRYSWKCTKHRWLHNFESIADIVEDVMTDYLSSVKNDEEQRKKIEFFEENY